MFDFIVIGNGLIGSAATRYLSATGGKTAGIGPGEPADWSTHQGVFASHYDQGRITRILDPDLIWAKLAQRAIEQYAAIESQSGIRFYYQTGGLRVDQPGERWDQAKRVTQALQIDCCQLDAAGLAETFPYFALAAGSQGLWEQGVAGYINPRSLVEAQLKIAAHQGASIIRETVVSVEKLEDLVAVRTAEGNVFQARKVLIAAGGFTNALLTRKLALDLRPRTILMAELPSSEIERLAEIPTLIYRFPGWEQIESIYMLPPIPYPDGKTYIKIGGTRFPSNSTTDIEAVKTYFRHGGSQAEVDVLRQVLLSIIPDLQANTFRSKPCILTYTPQDYPFIDALDDGSCFVATGGCGSSAKSSNEIGRAAALLVEHGRWTYDLPAEKFQAVYAE
jgi:sarcosine oxidase